MRTKLVISIGFSLVGLSCGVEDFDVEPGSGAPAESLESVSNEVVSGSANHRIDAVGYVLSITASGERSPRPECTGALIGPRAFVTSAYCVYLPNQRYVVGFGDFELNSTREIPVQKVLLHPDYAYTSGSGYTNDVAVLILERSAPARPFAIGSISRGANAQFMGYGLSPLNDIDTTGDHSIGPRQIPSERGAVTVRVLSANRSVIHVRGRGRGICLWDGGGALIDQSRRTIVGIGSRYDYDYSSEDISGMCLVGEHLRYAPRRVDFTPLSAYRTFLNRALGCQTRDSDTCRRLARTSATTSR